MAAAIVAKIAEPADSNIDGLFYKELACQLPLDFMNRFGLASM
jgi:hypothetical protein